MIAVRIVDHGCEYIPGSPSNGPDVTYLHCEATGTVIRIRGNRWGDDLEVWAQSWYGQILPADERNITWRTTGRGRLPGHKRIVAWWRDELAGLHRMEAPA